MSTDFERKWRRLLQVDRRAADRLRREHNREIMLREVFGHYWEFPGEPVYEEVVRMEDGKATTLRTTIRGDD